MRTKRLDTGHYSVTYKGSTFEVETKKHQCYCKADGHGPLTWWDIFEIPKDGCDKIWCDTVDTLGYAKQRICFFVEQAICQKNKELAS